MNARSLYRPLVVVAAVLLVSAAGSRPAPSAPALYDMTGHWVGTAVRSGNHGSAGLDLHIKAGPGTSFDGSGVLTTPEENAASIQGTATRAKVFNAQLDVPGQAHVKLQGKVHPNTNTVTGNFKGKNAQHKTIQGTFSMTKQP
jgi:hypothetical protein